MVQTKPTSKPKKQKRKEMSKNARKRNEITEKLNKYTKTKSNVIEEEVGNFRTLHF